MYFSNLFLLFTKWASLSSVGEPILVVGGQSAIQYVRLKCVLEEKFSLARNHVELFAFPAVRVLDTV